MAGHPLPAALQRLLFFGRHYLVILPPKINFQDLPIHRQIRLQLTEIDGTLQGFFRKRSHQKITALAKSEKLEFLSASAHFCSFLPILQIIV